MAFGNEGNNRVQKINVYSNYKMGNSDSKVDPSQLNFTMWNGNLLKMQISPLKQSNDGTIAYDHENGGALHLTYQKAWLLYQEICCFQNGAKAVGVNTNKGLVTVTDGEAEGFPPGTYVIIRLLDGNGTVTSSYSYEMNKTNYAIRDFNTESGEFSRQMYEEMELEQLKVMLKSFYEAMTNATAYSVANVIDSSLLYKVTKPVEAIADKLGVEYKSNKGGGGYTKSTSIFDRDTKSFKQGNMSDIDM